LDFQTVEALTQALRDYEGTIIVVSHDRGFIGRVGTKILEVSRGQVHLYPGTYDEYVWSLQQGLAAQTIEEEGVVRQVKKPAENKRDISKQIRQLEKEILSSEKKLEELENLNVDINDKISAGEPGTQLNELIKTMSANTVKIHELEIRWMELNEELNRLKLS
jgi:ATP-binding cassette, subfamily F, member 3